MNSVLHLDTSPGNIPYTAYTEMRDDPRVKLAVPYAVGDNYKGFRIVGTTDDLFFVEYQSGKFHSVQGRLFDDDVQEAVIGSYVARRLGLGLGDIFQPYHGLDYNPDNKHDADYVIVGILEPSNTPTDHVIWIPLKGLQNMPGHDKTKATEISAILLQFNSTQQGPIYADQVNKGTRDKTVAMIAPEVTNFFQRFEWLRVVLGVMAVLVALVGGGGILASLHNTMNERRREFAILRALGAGRGTVFGVIVLESATIAALGATIGFAVYAGIMFVAESILRNEIGVTLHPFEQHPVMAIVPVGLVMLGAVVGIIPALKAYRTDVAENLIPQS